MLDFVGRAKGHLALEPQQAPHFGCTIPHNDTFLGCTITTKEIASEDTSQKDNKSGTWRAALSKIFDTVPMVDPTYLP